MLFEQETPTKLLETFAKIIILPPTQCTRNERRDLDRDDNGQPTRWDDDNDESDQRIMGKETCIFVGVENN